nr:UDP-glycosyltransferase 86A1-like [Ipomoea trifida]
MPGKLILLSATPCSAVAADVWQETAGCGQWLDARPENSVVYISFGSFVNVGKEVIQEIAHSLLQNNKVSFLWAIRRDITGAGPGSEETQVLPAGFEDEVRDQFTNRKLVVDDWKVGINPCAGKEVGREEVAENMKHLMNDAEGFRENMTQRKKTLQNASSPNGSSEKNFEQFMHDIKLKIQQKSNISTKQ